MLLNNNFSGPSPGRKGSSTERCVPKEILFKFLVIGDYGVGKTAVVRRYTDGRFSSNYKITIGADFSMRTLQWDDCTKINLQLWDIAGHERFGCMTRVYYKYAVGAAIVFDLSRTATFQSVRKWLKDLREKLTLADGEPVPVVLLANKCDIPGYSVQTEAVNRFCKEQGIQGWFLTSAKNNVNIDKAVQFLVERAMECRHREIRRESDAILLNAEGCEDNAEKVDICC
ncbi:hypothetical protein ONE63_007243 [Megalurothrips usitatus]|uniref:Ras-related protein Rab n=1 Tax=Megalurothrips usitatus TaxID=439358 RepID=A0AAV7XSH6_9NEOP|nr:hypothetical protein ONE63_007243 [Megalurothrips usitatus]